MSFAVISVLFVSLTVSSAFGQSMGMPGFEEISGTYKNDKLGVEIAFPTGWSGMAMAFPELTTVMVSPGGMESMEEDLSIAMNLMVSEKSKVNSPPESPMDDYQDCDQISSKPTTVGGIQGTETVMICKDNGKILKFKTLSAETNTHLVNVMLMGSESNFDKEIGKFDNSVKTLKIKNMDTAETKPVVSPPTLQSSVIPVMVEENQIDLTFQSTSKLNNVVLDQESKSLEFTVNGDVNGNTVVSIGKILKGEFVVMIDGADTKSYKISGEQETQTLDVQYGSGTHEITIIGTQVVPEFGSIAVLILIFSIISIIGISAKTRLTPKF